MHVCVCASFVIAPQFDVLVYNPVARGNNNIVVRLPVSRKDLVVMTTSMDNVTCQVRIMSFKSFYYMSSNLQTL